ncbi:Hypothetical protein SCF082_LOCUS15827, partial [Durusdinium trenchii]
EQLSKCFIDSLTSAVIMLFNVPGETQGKPVLDLGFVLGARICSAYIGVLSNNGSVQASINLDSQLGNAKDIAELWKSTFADLYSEWAKHDVIVEAVSTWAKFLDKL